MIGQISVFHQKLFGWLNVKNRGKRKLEVSAKKLRVGVHLAVNIINILTVTHTLYIAITGDRPDLNQERKFHQFYLHCSAYKQYFLSLWVGALQYLYFSLYSIIDLLEIKCPKTAVIMKATDIMHAIASYLLFTIVFPLSMVIFIVFWSLYAYNRELIYPQLLDDFIPPLLNHVLHTLPVPLSGLYMLLSNKKEPSKIASLSGLVSFLAVYYYLYLSIYIQDGKWVYIIFNLLTFSQAMCALIFGFFVTIGFHFLGYKINDSIKHLRRKSDLIRLLNGGTHG